MLPQPKDASSGVWIPDEMEAAASRLPESLRGYAWGIINQAHSRSFEDLFIELHEKGVLKKATDMLKETYDYKIKNLDQVGGVLYEGQIGVGGPNIFLKALKECGITEEMWTERVGVNGLFYKNCLEHQDEFIRLCDELYETPEVQDYLANMEKLHWHFQDANYKASTLENMSKYPHMVTDKALDNVGASEELRQLFRSKERLTGLLKDMDNPYHKLDVELSWKREINRIISLMKDSGKLYSHLIATTAAYLMWAEEAKALEPYIYLTPITKGNAGITVTVVEEGTDTPIMGARPELYYTGERVTIGSKAGERIHLAIDGTGVAGTLLMMGLKPRGYCLYIQADGYREKAYGFTLKENQCSSTTLELTPLYPAEASPTPVPIQTVSPVVTPMKGAAPSPEATVITTNTPKPETTVISTATPRPTSTVSPTPTVIPGITPSQSPTPEKTPGMEVRPVVTIAPQTVPTTIPTTAPTTK